ncbi:MAG TPA: WGR domain-containing protein [Sphingobium sp.]|nr:WGR domain-containing protein [Sphingobium sp.]
MDHVPFPRPIHLRAIAPERNIARAYSIHVTPDLFGGWIVETRWGRIGSCGQTRRYCFSEQAVALRFVHMTLRRRRGASRRIGTAYRPVPLC